MKGLADAAMRMKPDGAKKGPAEPVEDEAPSELGLALDELFSLKGKEREAAFKAAVAMCSSGGEDESY